MAGAGAGADQGSPVLNAPGAAPGSSPEELRNWAGLPEDLLVRVAGALVAQTEAAWAAWLKEEEPDWTEERLQKHMAWRKRVGNCPLFVFAMVCKPWRKAQLKVWGPLRTRVKSDVLLPGRVALVKWALADPWCPRDDWEEEGHGHTMAMVAASYGHLELVRWLCGEGGFAMDVEVMNSAARSGNLELVQWLWGEGCPWDWRTCNWAVIKGHEEVLRWVRENGCPWEDWIRNMAARKLGYTDDLMNFN